MTPLDAGEDSEKLGHSWLMGSSVTSLENSLAVYLKKKANNTGGIVREFGSLDGQVHTAICKMDNQQGPTI